jgi:uncharacterized protein YndB with AHSA1/START domain
MTTTTTTKAAGELQREVSITIAAPMQRIWDELTKFDEMQRFYFDSMVRGQLKPGEAFRYESADGKYRFITGSTVEVEAPRRWVQDFQFAHLPDAPTRVTWKLADAAGGGVSVTVHHQGFAGPTKTYKMTERGWPSILQNLKAVIEKGQLPLGARFGNAMMRLFAPLVFKKSK